MWDLNDAGAGLGGSRTQKSLLLCHMQNAVVHIPQSTHDSCGGDLHSTTELKFSGVIVLELLKTQKAITGQHFYNSLPLHFLSHGDKSACPIS